MEHSIWIYLISLPIVILICGILILLGHWIADEETKKTIEFENYITTVLVGGFFLYITFLFFLLIG